MIEAGCEGEPVAQCAAPAQSPFVAKSSYVGGALPESAVGAITSALSSFPASLPGGGAGVVFDGYGGMINTGWGERHRLRPPLGGLVCPVLRHLSGRPADARSEIGGRRVARPLQHAFAPVTQGSYQNYIDPTLPDWQQAYYGSNLSRLQQVKRAHDPDDVFHFAQSIPIPS